jgi:hypothetical protein
MFYPLSLIISGLVLVPNLLFFLAKPVKTPANPSKEPVFLVICERLGQIICFIAPLFYRLNFSGAWEIIAALGMVLMLLVYYFCWIRFFTHGREYRWLYEPLVFIPIPMALFPLGYFLLASGVTHSIVMLISALVFAAGHIPISLIQYKHKQNVST